ncbi:hypothetical protein E2C01_100648 [Portunus trituberculatus]|uniref:Uncharacterized protein n=1 Tax=Portunus trituberculatus TaxID=210409 RepID=A0A5B7KDT8_PORTR|nr:hypothetical protein [Portunus trituberculatus]
MSAPNPLLSRLSRKVLMQVWANYCKWPVSGLPKELMQPNKNVNANKHHQIYELILFSSCRIPTCVQSLHAKCVTIMPKDIQLAHHIHAKHAKEVIHN